MSNGSEKQESYPVPSVVETPPNAPMVATGGSIPTFFGAAQGAAICNFIGDDMSRWRLTALACGGDVLGFDDQPPEGIALKYWYAHRVQISGIAAGEFRDAIRVVLIEESGRGFAFVSQGIADSLRELINAFGVKVFDPPLLIRVVQVTTRSKFKTMKIIPV